jgi:hydroxyacylglutathione hydrolase
MQSADIKAYGGSKQAPGTNTIVKEGSTFKIGQDIDVKFVSLLANSTDIERCYHTPCHTQDSICFFVKDKKTGEKGVFTG